MFYFIENHDSLSSKFVIDTIFKKFFLNYTLMEHGIFHTSDHISITKIADINYALQIYDLKVSQVNSPSIVNDIKKILYSILENKNEENKITRSIILTNKLSYTYNYLSAVFKKATGISIENYYIEIRINEIKRLIIHSQLTIPDIAFKLNFSSSNHMSNQFKKIVGMTLYQYKCMYKKHKLCI